MGRPPVRAGVSSRTYDVFDERRYFEPDRKALILEDGLGVTICRTPGSGMQRSLSPTRRTRSQISRTLA